MPIYGYRCDECGTAHEALVKVGGEPPVCPTCQAASDKQTKQLSTGTGFCLMGYGWHKNGMSVSGRK